MWKVPEGANMWVQIAKVKYTFENGQQVEGIEMRLAPGVKKFISMNSDKKEILQAVGNKLYDWYIHADFGDDTGLTAFLDE